MDAVLIAPRQTSHLHTLKGLHKFKLSTRDFFLLADLQPYEWLVSPFTLYGAVAPDLVATRQTPPVPIIYTLLGVAQV